MISAFCSLLPDHDLISGIADIDDLAFNKFLDRAEEFYLNAYDQESFIIIRPSSNDKSRISDKA
jgi:hypothetical protein